MTAAATRAKGRKGRAGSGPNAPKSSQAGDRGPTVLRARSDDPAAKTLDFIRSLRIPEGPLHGQNFSLAPFQEDFIRGVLAPSTMTAMLSVGRGQGKSMLSAALALAHLMGVSDDQPRRQVIIAARVKEQARIAWEYVQAIVLQLPEDEQALFTFRQAPRLEISYDGNGGGMIRAVAADAKNLLGLSPTLIIEDEFGHWHPDKGMQLHAALETSAGKRQAKTIVISTSASDDTHPFSQMLDTPPPHSFIIECRAPLGQSADDLDGIKAATARALALRGEAVFLIRDRLIPATDWDVTTRNGIPRAYRLGIPEIGGGRRETALAQEVLHFRIGCDGSTPWAGSAPLRRAQAAALLIGVRV